MVHLQNLTHRLAISTAHTYKTQLPMKDFANHDLTRHNTFGIKAKCRRFIEFDSTDDLRNALHGLTESDRPLLVIGAGSNLLLTGDYPGTVLHSAIKGWEAQPVEGGVLLRVGSGETWDDVVALCVEHGWHGAENLSLIPGEAGASAIQNIGAYGVEAKDIIYKVEAVEIETGCTVSFSNQECGYAYRQSRFKADWLNRYVITHVTYRLSTAFTPRLDYGNIRSELEKQGIATPTAAQLRNTIIGIRRTKLPDPEVEGNAGSFFMNPVVSRETYGTLAATYPSMPHYPQPDGREKIPAGWLIEQCGWKGRSLGRAGVCPTQALVLINKGGATGSEILNLCKTIQKDVKQKFGIDIKPEVNIR